MNEDKVFRLITIALLTMIFVQFNYDNYSLQFWTAVFVVVGFYIILSEDK